MHNFQNQFYSFGWEQAGLYMYGSDEQKKDAEQIYTRWCSQFDNENKTNFISGWIAHLLD